MFEVHMKSYSQPFDSSQIHKYKPLPRRKSKNFFFTVSVYYEAILNVTVR